MFPLSQLGQKMLSFGLSPDRHDLKKEVSEMSGIRTFRMMPAPGEALALNMDQATLDRDPWPQPAKHLEQVGIPVHCGTPRGQTPYFQVRAKSQQVFGTFRDIVSSHEELIALGIHHRKDSSAPFQEGAIENNMAMRGKVSFPIWRMAQPVFQNPTDRRNAVPALSSQLAKGIALYDPAFEPNALAVTLIPKVPPSKCATAGAADPTLSPMAAFPIPLDC